MAAVTLSGVFLVLPACGTTETEVERPNIVWIVWDTVRADRMSLYGHDKPTTPWLDAWASEEARVFDNSISAAPYTVPSHASMFTGLLPSEHGASNRHQYLDDHHVTVAELLRNAGYQTYLFAANPHISRGENFHRGFDVEEHPWDQQYWREALRIVREKVPPNDKSSELSE